MEIAEATAPTGQLADDEGCPPLRENLGSLSDRTELAVSLHSREVWQTSRPSQVQN